MHHPAPRPVRRKARRRSRLSRFLTIALVLFLAPVFAFGATVAVTGIVTVEIHEKNGFDLYLPVPALLVDLAVMIAPLAVPGDELAQARAEVAPYREALEALADELENCPSGILVDVKSGSEHVQVHKTWRSFEVEVQSPDADVRVKAPARLMGRALDLL